MKSKFNSWLDNHKYKAVIVLGVGLLGITIIPLLLFLLGYDGLKFQHCFILVLAVIAVYFRT